MLPRSPSPAGASIEVSGLSVRYPRAATPIVRIADLRLAPGDAVGLAGRSGAGKTTLLHAVAGLVPWLTRATVAGAVAVGGDPVEDLDPGQRARLVASCLDRPEAQLFLATVCQELDAARRLYGDGPLVDGVVEGLGLAKLLGRRIAELSSGERQRVALAVTLAGCPRPILLDEPTAHLDDAGARALVGLLQAARAHGSAILVTEQAGWRLGGSVTAWLDLDDGRLAPTDAPCPPEMPSPGHAPQAEVVLRCHGLGVARGERTLIEGADLELRRGEVVLLSGANGVGKSTLARVLAGLAAPSAGEVSVQGRVGLLLPETELQLFAATVAGEVAAAGTRRDEQARVLRRHRLEHLSARAPWSLSRGEQQRLVHAALDVLRPAVMIVDEPGQGLDPEDLSVFVDLIHRRAAKGRTTLLISHRRELVAAAHRHLVVEGGRLVEVSS